MEVNTSKITIDNKCNSYHLIENSNFYKIQKFLQERAKYVCGCRPTLSSHLKNLYLYDHSLLILIGDPCDANIYLYICPKIPSTKKIDQLVSIIKESILKTNDVNLEDIFF